MVRALLASGVKVCFANPGTTEMPLVASFDRVPGMRAVLGLHENVVTAAADGYARMTNAPACTLLHLGVGLANGLANLHNAKRALTPVVNIVGEMPTWHRPADALLAMDIEKVASAVSSLVVTCNHVQRITHDVGTAVKHARTKRVDGGSVVTMVVPHDTQRLDGAFDAQVIQQLLPAAPSAETMEAVELEFKQEEAQCGASSRADVDEASAAFLRATKKLLFLGSAVCRDDASLQRAGRIAAATGCHLMCENAFARVDRGAGRPALRRLPYFPDDARKELAQYSVVVFVGCRVPVAMFGYDDNKRESQLVDFKKQSVFQLNDTQTFVGMLEYFEVKVGAASAACQATPPKTPSMPTGTLNAAKLCSAIAALQPEGSIIVDESLTSGGMYWDISAGCPPFSHLTLTGGAIGIGPPLSVGVAVACPDRQVINFQADGSAMYTMQALWTQQRENLNIITVICSNGTYNILKIEQMKQKLPQVGSAAASLTNLGQPAIDWVQLAGGCGVKASRATSVEEFSTMMTAALNSSGPYLIEAMLH